MGIGRRHAVIARRTSSGDILAADDEASDALCGVVTPANKAPERPHGEADRGVSTAAEPGFGPRNRWLLAFAAVVVGFAVWRATLGVSMADDGSYVAIPLRFAQGSRPLADEMTGRH